jgi:hypothetical protein
MPNLFLKRCASGTIDWRVKKADYAYLHSAHDNQYVSHFEAQGIQAC